MKALSIQHFQTMARYNTLANERLFQACAGLSAEDLTENRGAFFGSVLGTLNHLLVGDRLWFGRFEGHPVKLALNSLLYEDFEALWTARKAEDGRIERYAARLTEEELNRELTWTRTEGDQKTLPLLVCLAQVFNHQTHHRGQVHCLLTQMGRPGVVLDIPYVLGVI